MNLKIKHILSRLTTTELETAARSNYLYLKNPVPFERNQFARGLVERNIGSTDGNVDVALQKIRKTLKFRQEMQIDDLITAFDNDNDNNKLLLVRLIQFISFKHPLKIYHLKRIHLMLLFVCIYSMNFLAVFGHRLLRKCHVSCILVGLWS
mmetsp:Transcript_29763/g.30273  ORF Transcript_29763/g.30273 Transcript_29763/m.30273 type:complete len:151 (+) Transcript_29763:161-613(+)